MGSAADGTTYSGNFVAGAPWTIVYAYSTPMPYAPKWVFTMSMTASYVSRPIALPFEHHGERGDRLGARLDHALHRVVVRELADVAAAVFDDIDFVAVVNGLNRRQRDAGFRPQSGQHDLLPAALLDGGDEVLVSSQEFMVVRSMGVCFGKTAWICGQRLPLKLLVSTVLRTTGTSKTLAAFARATLLLMIDWRSKLETPKSIWG